MKRSALRELLNGILLATLPLAGGCIGGLSPCPEETRTVTVDAGPGMDTTDAGCANICRGVGFIDSCEAKAGPNGTIVATCVSTLPCHTGRRPEGVGEPAPSTGGDAVGRYLAAAAFLEDAAVLAFRRLGRELAAHGADPSLVRRARRAAGDEVRHARAMTRLAKARGATVERASSGANAIRPLLEVALENAREGCVLETYGALVAAWQAARAADPTLREVLAAIADDELAHAELSWAVADFCAARLDAADRATVAAAARAAHAALARSLDADVDPALVTALGVPPREAARALAARLAGALPPSLAA